MDNALIRVVLDILKPHSPSLPSFAMYLSSLDGVDGVNITLMEIDEVVAGRKLVEEVTTPQD